jgi:tetratricopeptide (TPR) repeat protein/transcriptional regulator with XRE-family HTH domain
MDRGTGAPFGSLLKTFRTRRRLTQATLATALGVHRNTIGRWERGDVLPDTRGMVLELARHLHLSEPDTRQLLEASLTALTPYWNVPYPRNPCFTGREEALATLYAALRADQAAALTQAYAVSGLGGIGKTQLAVEYAYRHALEYSAIFWLGAESAESLMTGLQRLAELLGLPERQEADQQQMVAAVHRWLSMHRDWLLICDNVEELSVLQPALPPARQGALLLTTRLQALGTLAERLEVPPMSDEEGATLVLRRAKVLSRMATGQPLPAEAAAAVELVKALAGLPLALDQAGAYIEETGCRVADYLRHYTSQRKQLLSRRGSTSGEHPASVATTLLLAVEQAERDHPAAADLLRVCAFLHPEAIPEELLSTGASHLGPILGPVAADPYQFDLALAALRRLSLVTRHPETRTLSVHRLVQAVLKDQMDGATVQLWSERVVRLVNAAFPAVEFATWSQCERCLPHALVCVPRLSDLGSDTGEATELLYKAGRYLSQRGRYGEAEPLLTQAMAHGARQHHPDHPALIPLLTELADSFYYQGKFAQAEPLLYRALSLCEEHLGRSHLQTAETLDALAGVYRAQGKYAQAEPLYQRALTVNEQQLGPDHPKTAMALIHLAILYGEQGRYGEAEPLYHRALAVQEQQLGPDHPEIATTLNNLAYLHDRQGRYEEAEPLYQRALAIREQQLGPDHPDTTYVLNNLAALYDRAGKYAQAEPLYHRALAIRERRLGSDHPATANVLSNLATNYRDQGKYAQAESLFQRALAIREQQLGPDHPDTAISLSGLATLYREQGKYAQAEPLFQRALRIREQKLDPNHPRTAIVLHNLALLYHAQSQYEQAEPLYQRALSIREQRLGPDHPDTVDTLNQYVALLRELQREQEAARLEQRSNTRSEINALSGALAPAPNEESGVHFVRRQSR